MQALLSHLTILQELSTLITNNDQLREQFVAAEPEEAHDLLTSENTDPCVRTAFQQFINIYGHRSVGEVCDNNQVLQTVPSPCKVFIISCESGSMYVLVYRWGCLA